jgi:hypothetical protein
MGERVRAGTRYRVHGAAWGGEIPVKQVELSCDGGGSWVPVTLAGDAVPNSWRLWEFLWDVPAEAGPRTLIARATDDAGRTQPAERIAEYGTYMINHLLPITVSVE